MTHSELLEEVMSAVELDPNSHRVQRAEATRLMNLAMREISLRVGVPTLYLDVPSTGFVTGAFTLPTRIHPEGVRQVKVIEADDSVYPEDTFAGRDIDILSVAEANMMHKRWDDEVLDDEWMGPAFLVYSSASPDVGIRPVGLTSARYKFLVHALPPDMSEPDHEPFAVEYCDEDGETVRYPGAMPAYHRVVALHAAYELLQRLNNPAWQAYYARYQAMEQEMFNAATPVGVYLPSNPRSWRPVRHG